MCAKIRFICGSAANRARYRLRYKMLGAAIRRLKAGRNAPLKKRRRVAPIMSGVKRYGRLNNAGNLVLSPIIVSGPRPIYIAPRVRTAGFKKVFFKARPSAIYSGSARFDDLGILEASVRTIVRNARRILLAKGTILKSLHNNSLSVYVFQYICTRHEIVQICFIKSFYYFLMSKTGRYIRRFQKRGYEWEDFNNADDSWLKDWEFEFIDELWTRVWECIPRNGGNFYNNFNIRVPGRIPMRRIWRRNEYVTDDSVKQIIRYLIEELIDPVFWNAIFALIF